MQKILLVEDNDELRRLYTELLVKKNYEIETAPNGADGIEKLGSFNPDIVILDIMLPDTNGIEILKQIKSNERYKKLPVIMLTGVSEIKKIQKSLELGAVGYIMKGSSIEEISRKIGMILTSFSPKS